MGTKAGWSKEKKLNKTSARFGSELRGAEAEAETGESGVQATLVVS